jgi:Uma2 family endonuclease
MSALTSSGGGMIPPFPIRPFTVDEYHRMIQAGIFTENDRVELLEGWITPKMPRNPPHDGTLDRTEDALAGRLPPGWRVRSQKALTLADSEPEPDIVIVPGPASRFLQHHPGPADVALLVEVADATLSYDRNEKGRIYARAGIPLYWLVNLVDARVEVYSDPTGPLAAIPAYHHRQDFALTDSVGFPLAGQIIGPIPVAEFLG